MKEEKERVENQSSVSSEAVAAALHFALLHEGKGDLNTASVAFKSLLMIDPFNPYFHAMLGSIHQRQQDDEGAERHYREAIKLFPSDVDSLTNLGEILLKTKRLQEGVELLKKAVNLDPERNHPSGNRARLLLIGLQDKSDHSPASG